MSIYDLPAINASFNAASTVLILSGLVMIKQGKQNAHIACMIGALVTSTAFLTCYLIYHYQVGSVKFTYPAPYIRGLYFTILLTHIAFSTLILPLVAITVVPALKKRFDTHKKWARLTAPIWLYVSVTGVLIYLMLYQWFPSADIPG